MNFLTRSGSTVILIVPSHGYRVSCLSLTLFSANATSARLPTKSLAVSVDDPAFTWLFGSGSIGPLPVLVLWTALKGDVAHRSGDEKVSQPGHGRLLAGIFTFWSRP